MAGRLISGRVIGRVQGVWFRRETKREADRLDLQGWVRNEPDGSVSFFAAGAATAVEQLLDWLAEGPPLARVERLEVEELAAEPQYTVSALAAVFEIRR